MTTPGALIAAGALASEPLARASLELALVGALAGPVGWLVLGQRVVFAAESATHGMLPGLALAAVFSLPLAAGALAGIVAFGALLAIATRERRAGSGAAIAALATGFLAAGSLAALLPGSPGHLERLLFGEPLAVTDGDLVIAALALAVCWGTLARLRPQLVAAMADPAWAAASGLPIARLRTVALVLVVIATAVAATALGNLLALALVVAPALAARPLARGSMSALVVAAAIAVGGSLAGLALAYALDTATGATIALALVASALASAAGQRLRAPSRR